MAFLGALILGYLVVFWKLHDGFPTDSFTYYLAGLRLNTGGQIYDLRPTDYWPAGGVPLYGPPVVAVIWRPLAAIPGQWGILLWIVLIDLAAIWAVGRIVLDRPAIGGLALIILSLPIERMIGVGNVDGLVLIGMIGAWRFRDRPGVLGSIIGFLIALKLTPAFLAIWLVSTRRWRAFACALLVGAGLLVVTSALANDPGIVIRYVAVMREGLVDGFPWARFAVVAGTIAVVVIGRRWPRLGFSLAVVLIPVASPVTALHTFALLLAAIAPWLSFVPTRAPAEVPAQPGLARQTLA